MTKSDYTAYTDYLESLGWRLQHTTLTEKNTNIVTTSNNAVATTAEVIDVRCPAGQKISIMGTRQVPIGDDPRISYSLGIELCSSYGIELSPYTKIRITKEKPTSDVVQLARLYYSDISISRLNEMSNKKDKSDQYKFSHGLELNGEEHLYIYTISSTDDGCPSLPDIAIDRHNTKLSLEVDKWSS